MMEHVNALLIFACMMLVFIGNFPHYGVGTWRTVADCQENALVKLPFTITTRKPLVEAATMSVNLCTAYRLLVDNLQNSPHPDVVVLQNAGNSGVGRAVVQLARLLSGDKRYKLPQIKTLSIIRQREDSEAHEALVGELKSLGSTWVRTDTECNDALWQKKWYIDSPNRVLAFNAVCGRSASDLARLLSYVYCFTFRWNLSQFDHVLALMFFVSD
jgi:trans-2-enoyl-CoA reductase